MSQGHDGELSVSAFVGACADAKLISIVLSYLTWTRRKLGALTIRATCDLIARDNKGSLEQNEWLLIVAGYICSAFKMVTGSMAESLTCAVPLDDDSMPEVVHQPMSPEAIRLLFSLLGNPSGKLLIQ